MTCQLIGENDIESDISPKDDIESDISPKDDIESDISPNGCLLMLNDLCFDTTQ